MRVALISDLHGNLVALDAVLASIEARAVDRVVCLGDVATLGAAPVEVLDRLHELGVTSILGNHDDFLLQPDLIHGYTEAPVVVQSVDWCREKLAPRHFEQVRAFVPRLELALSDTVRLDLFHGSPRSHMENVLATTPPELLDEMLGPARAITPVATIMAGGHTHLQMLRQHHGVLIVNPGSVGMPFREFASGGPPTLMPHAEYAIVGADAHGAHVELHRVPLDRDALAASVHDTTLPLAPSLRAAWAP